MASRSFPANVQIQKFLEESYNKERDQRLAWHTKLGPKESGKSKQFEVFKRKIEGEGKPVIAAVPKNKKEARHNRRIIGTNEDITIPNNPEFEATEMRPVSPNTKVKLYDGFTKEGKGRHQYLHERNEKNPEDKFSFPLVSSWEYGWRLGDCIRKENIKKPANGRTRIVADTFYTRTGIPSST